MLIVDKDKFYTSLKKAGYRSVKDLADSLQLHRNTIQNYLSGHSVLPQSLEKVFEKLDQKATQLLVDKPRLTSSPYEEIAPLVDQLHAEFPQVTFVLFGSRAQRREHRHSDWDIGVFRKEGLPHPLYRQILKRKNDLLEKLPYLVDLVNLNRAERSFLQNASRNWTFLTGRYQDWLELQKRVLSS